MAEHFLNLEFMWLPYVEDIAEIDDIASSKQPDSNLKPSGPILKLKKDLSKFCGFPIFIQDCKKRIEFPDSEEKGTQKKSKTEHALFYLEFLYNISCNAKLEKSLDYDLKRFVNLFFSVKHGKLIPELYLKYDPAAFDVKVAINTENKAKDLATFSLGNFVGLNTFCERFHSSTSINDGGYKITQNRLVVLHDYKKMILYFVVGKVCRVKKRNATTHLLHKMEIPYSSLHSVIISKNELVTVYIRILQPPLMYSVIQSDEEECDYTSFHEMSYKTQWFRAIDLYENRDSSFRIRREFTMNTVLKLDFKKSEYDCFYHLMTHCKNVQIFFAPVNVVSTPTPPTELKLKLDDFECYYAFQCLLSHSYEIIDQLTLRNETDLVRKYLQEKSKENPVALSEALYLIFEAIIKGNVLIFLPCLKVLYERLQLKSCMAATEEFSKSSSQQNHLLLIKRVIITPTHLLLLPPQPTLKSRALRDCDPGYSLRLSIKDVNMDTLNFSIRGFGPDMAIRYRQFFTQYYREQLLKGLQIGNRCYKYVGSSTSQLKGHGLWLYAKDGKQRTADDLRKKFGKLEKIKHVPKYMARMGQTFSQSMGHIKVPQSLTNINDPEDDITGGQKKYLDVSEVTEKKLKFLAEVKEDGDELKEEVKEEEDPYTFSDGIGRISVELAEEVYKELNVEESRPSAMQIRYAGCKGMLVVDPNLEGKKILFRKSMRKFDSEHDSLEILKFSEKRSAFLNRPFITILEQLGVGKEVFLQLQKEMIQNHITSMFHESAACQFLHRHSLLRFDFLSMHSAGFHFTEDPLFRSMIYALFQKQIELLKKKANVEIPVDNGRTMFGVIDDTFTLEYGQVFVQYSKWDTNIPEIVEGTVVVTKNPCMHPGDVRKFDAIDVKALHHIVDCIVFPAKGPRPHPDEMAGSDLDGDEYHVMWLGDLTFPKDNQTPMDFAIQSKPEGLGRDVEIADELDHFCEYIFNDRVGLIASSHLVFADQLKDGIFSDVCIRLAKQYSLALDFAKSGIPVTRNHKDIAISYPDFMGKLDEKRTYLSNQALGMLYRSCKRLELGLETEKNEIDYKVDNALIHKDWDKKYKKSALRLYKKYCDKIEFYLRTYGFENEGQLLAGALVNPPKHYQNRHDMDNLMALLEFEVQFIFRDLERRFFDEFGGKPKDGVYTDDMLQKASAWYMVSYSKSEQVGSRFFGMPWSVSKVLIELKNKNRDLSAPEIIQSKTILEEIVDKSVSKHFPAMSPETDSKVIYENRLQVLDVAQKILSRWVKSQREYFSDPDIKKVEKCVSKEFDNLTSNIVCCDARFIDALKNRAEIKKVISPCYQVIEAMLHIAKIGAQKPQFKLSDVRQEVGLLAWMTLIKLACTYNPQYLGIPNEAGQYARSVFYKPQDNIIDTIQLPLFDSKNEGNMKFSHAVTHDYEEVKEYLIQQTKIKDIDFRYVQLRDSACVRITVQGTRYSIERLKDIVVMKEFFDAVAERKPLSYYL